MSESPLPYTVVHNRAAHRFEVQLQGERAALEYAETDANIDLLHTKVPASLGGHGVGGALALAALEYAKASGKRVIPTCPFVRAYIERHPDWKAIVASAP